MPDSTMTPDERDQLTDKLIDLMAQQNTQWRGAPYVNADGSFGITAGKEKGGLYAAYHLIDSLAAGGVFAGAQNPRTDLDTAIYELRADNYFRVYDEAKLFWNQSGELEVTIRTEKSVADIVSALDSGINAARRETRRKMKEEADWKEAKKQNVARDNRPPVFSQQADIAFMVSYLEQKTADTFPDRKFTLEKHKLDDALAKLLDDYRDHMRITYQLADGDNYGAANTFGNETLQKVFPGPMNVSFNQASMDGRPAVSFDIAGSASRLVEDILNNDAPGARRAIWRMEDRMGLEMMNKVTAEIDAHDRAGQVAASTAAAIAAGHVAPKTAKFRKP